MPTRAVFLILWLPVLCTAQPAISSVLNAASFNEMFAPGAWITITGTGLAANEATASGVPLPKSLGGASVNVDGKPAGLLYAAPKQINALIPYEIAGGPFGKVSVVVTTSAGASASYSIYINRNAPALFTLNASGSGRAVVFDASTFQTVDTVTENNIVVLYAAGLGQTNPSASSYDGATVESRIIDDLEVFIGDQEAKVLYAGLAPGFPGVYQLNVRVPSPWTDRLYLRQGGWVSNITEVGIPPQNDAINITGSITPAMPDYTVIDISQFLIAASYSVEFQPVAGARPFVVAAVSEGGGTFMRIDPANGMYQAWAATPTSLPLHGDFSFLLPQPLMDFRAGCTPSLANLVPGARMPQYWLYATLLSGPAEITFAGDPTGIFEFQDSVQIGSHFGNARGFAAFLQVPCGSRASQPVTFKLYIDGKLIDSKQVSYKVMNP